MSLLTREEFYKRLGLVLKRARIERGLSQAEVVEGLKQLPVDPEWHLRRIAALSVMAAHIRRQKKLTPEQVAERGNLSVEFVRDMEAAKIFNPEAYEVYCLSFGLAYRSPGLKGRSSGFPAPNWMKTTCQSPEAENERSQPRAHRSPATKRVPSLRRAVSQGQALPLKNLPAEITIFDRRGGNAMTRRRTLPVSESDFYRRVDEIRRCSGVVVTQLRDEKGWTQAELAQRAGVSLRWLKALESNQLPRNYRSFSRFKAAQALDFGVMEIKDFVGLIEDMVNKNIGRRAIK